MRWQSSSATTRFYHPAKTLLHCKIWGATSQSWGLEVGMKAILLMTVMWSQPFGASTLGTPPGSPCPESICPTHPLRSGIPVIKLQSVPLKFQYRNADTRSPAATTRRAQACVTQGRGARGPPRHSYGTDPRAGTVSTSIPG